MADLLGAFGITEEDLALNWLGRLGRKVLAGRLGPRLCVQDHNFSLPVAIRRVMTGADYAVYVAPRSKLIVAMEPDTRRSG